MRHVLAVVACGLVVGGCSSGGPKVAGKASDEDRAVLLDRVKSLEGTWEMVGSDGQAHVAATFKASSAGSVVREIMFPGQGEEMTNIYHMDGPTLVMTHYCAMGNQPRLRATPGDGSVIALKFDSVTNLGSAGESCMGGMTLTIKDKDHIVEDWSAFKDGKDQPHTRFELRRQKAPG